MLITWILLFCLSGISLAMFIWGLVKKERIYQYPTIAGATWLFYIIPQAIGGIRNPYKFPSGVISDYGIEIALFMCILSALAGWFGYKSNYWKRVHLFKKREIFSERKLFRLSLFLYMVAFFAAYKLAALTGGFVEQFTKGGHYSMEWSGLPVRYAFVANLMYPAIMVCLFSLLRKPNFIKLITLVIFLIYPLCMIIFLGRRGVVLYLGLIFLLTFFFTKKWVPSRILVFAMLIFLFVFNVVAPQYRTITQYGVNFEELKEIDIKSSLKDVIEGNTYLEFDAFVVNAAAINKTLKFGYGSSFYNSTISQLIPKELIGAGFKEKMMISQFTEPPSFALYGWTIPYGSNPTGPLNAFQEFWFFGAFLYFIIGVFSRYLWEESFNFQNLKAQIWYIFWVKMISTSIFGALIIIPAQIIIFYIFITPVLKLSKIRLREVKSNKYILIRNGVIRS